MGQVVKVPLVRYAEELSRWESSAILSLSGSQKLNLFALTRQLVLSHGLLARSHIDLLHLNLSPGVRGNSNQSRLSTSATVAGKLEEVIRVADGFLPGLAAVSANFHLGRPTSRVLDRGREPVLRGAAVHLDPERVGEGARHEFPFDVDLAEALVGQLREHVRRHVEVLGITSRLVGDLRTSSVRDGSSSCPGKSAQRRRWIRQCSQGAYNRLYRTTYHRQRSCGGRGTAIPAKSMDCIAILAKAILADLGGKADGFRRRREYIKRCSNALARKNKYMRLPGHSQKLNCAVIPPIQNLDRGPSSISLPMPWRWYAFREVKLSLKPTVHTFLRLFPRDELGSPNAVHRKNSTFRAVLLSVGIGEFGLEHHGSDSSFDIRFVGLGVDPVCIHNRCPSMTLVSINLTSHVTSQRPKS
ncbi:hypothetical protein KC341_g89 [Hortaea werneckii]|nr:hypothetical protein KC341_g89 [Hortaea werneckii]